MGLAHYNHIPFTAQNDPGAGYRRDMGVVNSGPDQLIGGSFRGLSQIWPFFLNLTFLFEQCGHGATHLWQNHDVVGPVLHGFRV